MLTAINAGEQELVRRLATKSSPAELARERARLKSKRSRTSMERNEEASGPE
jgi:hypothetical protein